MADPVVTLNEAAGRFEAQVDCETAFAEFQVADGVITFPHTVVPDAIEGQGVGSALVRAGLDHARAQGLKVKPRCSFFARYMAKHSETQDLLHPDFKDRL